MYIYSDADVSEDEQVILYKAEDIEKHPRLALTTAGLMLIALLVGGDYDVSDFSLITFCELTEVNPTAWHQELRNRDRIQICMCRLWGRPFGCDHQLPWKGPRHLLGGLASTLMP